MIGIVPLAGPDFVHPRFGVRPLVEVHGRPLIRHAIESRIWWKRGQLKPADLIFVLRRMPEADDVARKLTSWFEGARFVYVSDVTRGALFSALAGAALVRDLSRPICIDLVDILYDCDRSPVDSFGEGDVAGVIPWFAAADVQYSYLEIADGRVVRTAEKEVISNHASVGTYFFRDLPTFFAAASSEISKLSAEAPNRIGFICPSYNGLIRSGGIVLPFETRVEVSLSPLFKV